MISFDTDNGRFSFRSAAVVIQDDHLLIHRNVNDDFWALPGGRVELFETSAETVVREMHEELGLQCPVERQLWHVENFFEFDANRFHELANYFLVSFTKQPIIESEQDIRGIEKTVDLIFRWVPLSRLDQYTLKPDFLIEKLNDLPQSIEALRINQINA